MKKKWIWIGLGGALVVLLVAGNVARQSQGKIVSVQFARVRRTDITARVRAPGKIEPRTQVKVSADVMGKIVQLPIKEGDRVKKGELMLQLDDTQYRSAYSQARAARASAEARVRETESSLKVAQSSYARQKALFEQHLLSEAEWDQATTNYESARAAVATGREEVARSQAALEGASDNLQKCRFLAPFDGVVSALNVEAGEVVITGTMNNPGTQILVVSDLSRMLVRADVDETDVVDLKLGQKAKITVDALPDTSFPGTVTEIGNTAKRTLAGGSEGQTNFEVKVVFDQDVPQVRPGMTADVEIETGTREKTLGVPIQAVVIRTQRELERAGKRERPAKRAAKADASVAAEDDTIGRKEKEITGMFVVRDGTAAFVPVRTGLASESEIEIFGDTKEGESVVAGPYKALRELKPNTKVKKEAPGGRGRKG
jgi:HlyD family secretion protein